MIQLSSEAFWIFSAQLDYAETFCPAVKDKRDERKHAIVMIGLFGSTISIIMSVMVSSHGIAGATSSIQATLSPNGPSSGSTVVISPGKNDSGNGREEMRRKAVNEGRSILYEAANSSGGLGQGYPFLAKSSVIHDNNGCTTVTSNGNAVLLKAADKSSLCVSPPPPKKTGRLVEIRKGNEGKRDEDCVPTVKRSTLVCQARNVIDKIVGNEHYKILVFGNTIGLYEGGKLAKLVLVEQFRYDVKESKKKKKRPIYGASLVLKYNKLGNLISKEGSLPKVKTFNPCDRCMSLIEKGNRTMDGLGLESQCSGCEMESMITTVGSNVFQKKHVPASRDDDDDRRD